MENVLKQIGKLDFEESSFFAGMQHERRLADAALKQMRVDDSFMVKFGKIIAEIE